MQQTEHYRYIHKAAVSSSTDTPTHTHLVLGIVQLTVDVIVILPQAMQILHKVILQVGYRSAALLAACVVFTRIIMAFTTKFYVQAVHC